MLVADVPDITAVEEGDEWKVQSVLIKKQAGEETARDQAEEIIETIES